jgi:2-polyprenyl-3-methyl-5-hydroxy-6-metoxy-1,4-benzoquinol methylase
MTVRDFAPIADSLRQSVIDFYAANGEVLEGAAGVNTLETNSGFVERRGEPLLEMLQRSMGVDSIEGLRLIDLGCGFGALSAYFAARGAIVTGVDPIESRLEVGRSVAAEHGLPAEFEPGRMEDLELPDGSFDLAVQNNSLCYIVSHADRQAALLETARVLVPGGHLIIRNPNRWSARDQFTGFPLLQLLPPQRATRLAERLGRPRSLVRLTSPPEAARELRRAGFENVVHVGSPASRWPSFTKPFARYQHLTARKPA